MEEKRSVFSIPTPFRTGREAFVIDDDDDEDDSSNRIMSAEFIRLLGRYAKYLGIVYDLDSAEPEPEEDKTVYVVPANIGEIIDDVISKLDIKNQRKLCVDFLQKKLDDQGKNSSYIPV